MRIRVGPRGQSDIQPFQAYLMTAPYASEAEAKDFLTACVDMVGRMGAEGWQLRFHDDESPTVWIALATFTGRLDNIHMPDGGHPTHTKHEVAAALSPQQAAFRLLEQLVDGGHCTHCHKTTGITSDFDDVPLHEHVCWYQYDPELKTFRRGCE